MHSLNCKSMDFSTFRALGVIPARSGSKGVPRKNIRPLCGKPLIAYTAEAALHSKRLTRVILSTEDEEIAQVGREWGLEVPFMRPVELARDDTPMLPVVQHATRWAESEGDTWDAICLLQPTNPMRTAEEIDGCIELLISGGADAVVTILPVPLEYHPYWVYLPDEEGQLHLSNGKESPIPRRQDLPPAYHREGSVYVTRRDILLEGNSLYGKRLLGYRMDPERSVNIDTPSDWERAEQLLYSKANEGG